LCVQFALKYNPNDINGLGRAQPADTPLILLIFYFKKAIAFKPEKLYILYINFGQGKVIMKTRKGSVRMWQAVNKLYEQVFSRMEGRGQVVSHDFRTLSLEFYGPLPGKLSDFPAMFKGFPVVIRTNVSRPF